MKFSIKDFFSKCDQIRADLVTFLQKKYLMENFIFCAVWGTKDPSLFFSSTAQKKKYSIKDLFSQCEQIRRFTAEIRNGKLQYLCGVTFSPTH